MTHNENSESGGVYGNNNNINNNCTNIRPTTSNTNLCCPSFHCRTRSRSHGIQNGNACENEDNYSCSSVCSSSNAFLTAEDHRRREQQNLLNSCGITTFGGSAGGRRRPTPFTSTTITSAIVTTARSSYGPFMFSRNTTMASSLAAAFEDSMTEIVIEDIQNENEPTSAILDYCKRKFLRPYVTILAFVGLNPMSTDTTVCRACISYFQAALIICILCVGYFFQYLTSYRGDRGFSNYQKLLSSADLLGSHSTTTTTTATLRTVGELLFGYVIPSGLHLIGFISAIIVCKFIDHEQLQNLIERVFLMSMKPRYLCQMLWLYVFAGFLFLGFLFGYVVPSVLMQVQIVKVSWLSEPLHDYQNATKITLLVTLLVQDLVEIIIITSYCIECYLLRVHLSTLSHKLLMHTIESIDWMRDVLEFRKLLDNLNNRVAVPVCFLTVMNLSYAFAGSVYLFKDFDFHYSPVNVVVLNIINICLWLVMGLAPFFMASSVTRVCQIAQTTGHHIRVRPFLYHNTSADDLNSTLLFASTLDMSAKLFRMPIQPNYLCFTVLVISVVVLTLGMCLNLSALDAF